MNYPEYAGDFPDRRPDLLQALIHKLGTDEPDNRQAIGMLNHNDPYRASLLVGRACSTMAANRNETPNVDCILEQANEALAPVINRNHANSVTTNSSIQHLSYLVNTLIERNDPQAVSRYQKATHADAIQGLTNLSNTHKRTIDSELAARRAGISTQLKALGLLSRLVHPWLMATSSLPHLDAGHRSWGNYDLLIVEAGPVSDPVAQKVQLKRSCLGFCGNREGIKHGEKMLERYSNDIVLVSEHCDIRISNKKPVGLMLRKEAAGKAKPTDIRALDILTNGLILTITAGSDRRRGKLPDRPLQPFVPPVKPYETSTKRPVTPKDVAARLKR